MSDSTRQNLEEELKQFLHRNSCTPKDKKSIEKIADSVRDNTEYWEDETEQSIDSLLVTLREYISDIRFSNFWDAEERWIEFPSVPVSKAHQFESELPSYSDRSLRPNDMFSEEELTTVRAHITSLVEEIESLLPDVSELYDPSNTSDRSLWYQEVGVFLIRLKMLLTDEDTLQSIGKLHSTVPTQHTSTKHRSTREDIIQGVSYIADHIEYDFHEEIPQEELEMRYISALSFVRGMHSNIL